MRGVLWLQFVANSAGAVIIFLYLQLLFPLEAPKGQTEVAATVNLVVFSSYLFLTVLVAFPLNAHVLGRAIAWVGEGRPPTARERHDTLAQPFRQTTSAFVGWLGAAIIFGIINSNAARVPIGIMLAGLLTCSMLYLLLERHFRPMFALALADGELPPNRREVLPRLMAAWLIGSAIPLAALGLAPITAPSGAILIGWRLSVIVFTVLVAGGLLMRAAAGSVAAPINRVRRALGRVQAGDLDVHLPVDNQGEIGRLAAGFNSMVDGLREREQLSDLLDHQVGPEVARRSLEEQPVLGGGRRVVTVLFVDVQGYTAFAESHTPEQVMDMLNEFFGAVIEVISDEGGHVNKYEGDAALCIFGAPEDQYDHAARALRAAARVPQMLDELPVHVREGLGAGIGIATGEAMAGYVGTPTRYEYTVIGDVVNVAHRLTELAKETPGGVLATAETVEAAGATDGMWERAGTLPLRGRSQETQTWRLVLEPTG